MVAAGASMACWRGDCMCSARGAPVEDRAASWLKMLIGGSVAAGVAALVELRGTAVASGAAFGAPFEGGTTAADAIRR